jgi:FtsK/SpoIIIE family
VLRAIRSAIFRSRKVLLPIGGLPLVAELPSVGRAVGLEGVATPLAAGAGLTVAAATWVDRRERRFVVAAGAVATLWSALAWQFGVGRLLLAALIALWLPATVVWWLNQRVHSRIVVHVQPVRLLPGRKWWLEQLRRRAARRSFVELWRQLRRNGPAWWASQLHRRHLRRVLREILGDWRRTASAAEVPGCRIRRAEADDFAYTLHVQLRRGQTHKAMLNHHAALGSSLGAETGTLRIELETRMDRVVVRWVHKDPLAGPGIQWPFAERPEVASVAEPFTLGPNELGERVRICLADGVDTLIVGVKNAGKSVLLNVVIAAVAGMRDAVLWGIDPAGEVEFGPWGPVWNRLASDAVSTSAMLAALERVVQVRLRMLRQAGIRNWEPRLGPFVIVVIDELAQLKPAHRARLAAIVQLCRKTGVRVIVATQHPAAEDTHSGLRSQLDRVICLRLKNTDAVRMAFGRDMVSAGWDPANQLTLRGTFLIYDPSAHLTPIVARAYWITDAEVAAAAERLCPTRPELDTESAMAARDTQATRADQEVDRPSLSLVPDRRRPGGIDEDRLARLRDAIRRAGRPISGRAAARLADIPNSWVAATGLPELRERGEITQTESEEWVPAEEPTRAAGGRGLDPQ